MSPQTCRSFALISGVVFLVMYFAAAMASVSVSGGAELWDAPMPGVDFLRQLVQFGFGLLLIPGMFAAALMVAATSADALRTGALPRWLAGAGFVVAVVLLASAAFLPAILFPLWVLTVSTVMLRPTREAGGAAA